MAVDDNDINRIVIKAFLEIGGAEAQIANSGAEAIEMALNEHFDVILMDIQMPVMNGEQSAAQIRSLSGPKNVIPIIAITANANSADARRLLDSDFDGFLSKPFRREDLLRTLQESFAR